MGSLGSSFKPLFLKLSLSLHVPNSHYITYIHEISIVCRDLDHLLSLLHEVLPSSAYGLDSQDQQDFSSHFVRSPARGSLRLSFESPFVPRWLGSNHRRHQWWSDVLGHSRLGVGSARQRDGLKEEAQRDIADWIQIWRNLSVILKHRGWLWYRIFYGVLTVARGNVAGYSPCNWKHQELSTNQTGASSCESDSSSSFRTSFTPLP